MSQERRLAFLQNFYTDVTLYVPAAAETGAPAHAGPAAAAPAAPPELAAGGAVAAAAVSKPAVAAVLPASTPPAALPAAERPAAPAAAPAAARLPSLSSLPTEPPGNAAPAPGPVAATSAAAPAAPTTVPPVMLTTFSTLGDNAQGVVLLFRLPPEQFRKLPRNVFLNKLLQALDLVMTDVVLVNVESHLPVALSNLRREVTAGRILAFGRNLLDVAVRNTQIYEPVQFTSLNLSYLAAAEVELLEYDTSLNKRLWAGLQRMFLG